MINLSKKKTADKRGKKAKAPQWNNKRAKQKYPALDKNYNLKIRHELFDQDYIHLLNEEEKKFLNKFNSEFFNASVDKKEPLHSTDELRKDVYDRNNSRNRDIYAISIATGLLKDEGFLTDYDLNNRSTNLEETEETLINLIEDFDNANNDSDDQAGDT